MLGGGIQSGQITEIFGDPGSGKTQFALQLSANAAYNHQYAVSIFTTGEVNPERILEIMKGLKKVK